MKQHIKTKQLYGLDVNSEARRELRGRATGDRNHHAGVEKEVCEFWTIGRMIEFLFEHDKDRTFISWDSMPFGVTFWFGKIEHDKKNNQIIFRDGFGHEELTDALWEAVKEILNE